MSLSLHSQDVISKQNASKKIIKRFKKIDKKIRAGKKEDALKALKKMQDKTPNFINAYIQSGGLLLGMGREEEAISHFEKAIQLDSFYELKIYSTIGILMHEKMEYSKALPYLEIYKSRCTNTNNCKTISNRIKQIEFALNEQEDPRIFVPKPLRGDINTESSEYLSSMTADGNTMVFTRLVNGQEDLFVSYWSEENGYSIGQPISELNTHENEGAHTLSADGKTLIFTYCDPRKTIGSCDLYISTRETDHWSKPKSMGDLINSISWDGQPCLSADGQKLFFSSARRGGHGGRDIWVSLRNGPGDWRAPQNLGPVINSNGNEASPYLHQDLRTLYFRSDGHEGFGAYDLYMTRFSDNYTKIDTVLNLGYPINTPFDEGAMTITNDGKHAYFASDRMDNNTGKIDLYTFELDSLIRPYESSYFKIKVLDAETSEPLICEIAIEDLMANWNYELAYTDETGEYMNSLPGTGLFSLTIRKEGYLFHSEAIDFRDTLQIHLPLEKLVLLSKILPQEKEESKPVVLKNIFFKSNSAILLENSAAEIGNLVDILEKYPEKYIRITGFTDNVGSSESNIQLSSDRAQAVLMALVKEGINKERISYLGMGESSPIDTNETAQGRQNNRRTEFVLYSK